MIKRGSFKFPLEDCFYVEVNEVRNTLQFAHIYDNEVGNNEVDNTPQFAGDAGVYLYAADVPAKLYRVEHRNVPLQKSNPGKVGLWFGSERARIWFAFEEGNTWTAQETFDEFPVADRPFETNTIQSNPDRSYWVDYEGTYSRSDDTRYGSGEILCEVTKRYTRAKLRPCSGNSSIHFKISTHCDLELMFNEFKVEVREGGLNMKLHYDAPYHAPVDAFKDYFLKEVPTCHATACAIGPKVDCATKIWEVMKPMIVPNNNDVQADTER